jgi:adenylate cyclase class 2
MHGLKDYFNVLIIKVMKEIEIQVQVDAIAPLLDFLKANGQFKNEKHQVDEYFTPAHRDFTAVRPTNEWLRLRDSGGKASVNYKVWHQDTHGKSTYADEFETPIEDIVNMRKIFEVLNFKSLTIVDKVRKTWAYGDYEIAIDSVKGLGEFVEIERLTNENVDVKKIVDEMIGFIKSLGCGKVTRNFVGYPFMLLFKDEIRIEVL